MVLRFLGESVTDSNGLAVLPDGYTGTGAGEIDVVAKTEIDDSSLQSEPYPVLDCMVRDGATSNDKNDTMWSSVTGFTRGADSTTVSISSQVYTAQYNVGDGVAIEYDLFDIVDKCVVQIARYQDGQTTSYDYQVYGTACKVRVEVTTDKIIFKAGNTVIQTVNSRTNNKFRFFFLLDNTSHQSNFKYKDFKVYPI